MWLRAGDETEENSGFDRVVSPEELAKEQKVDLAEKKGKKQLMIRNEGDRNCHASAVLDPL